MKEQRTIKRVPRPLGLTLSAQKHNNKELKDKLITEYISNNFTINQKHYSITQLSTIYNIPITKIYKRIGEHNNSLAHLAKSKEGFQQQLGAIAMTQINNSLEDKALIQQQLALLLRSQGDSYKAFISSEVGKTLGLMLQGTKNTADIVKLFSGGSGNNTTNILIQGLSTDEQQGPKGITADEALKRIHERNKALPQPKALHLQSLEAKHGLQSIPEVSVKLSDDEHIPGQIDTQFIGHEDRREDEYDIDSESDEV